MPDAQHNPALSAAVLCVALIGFHAPDGDAILRLRGNESYIKHHRGWSHSLPAMLHWPLAISPLAARDASASGRRYTCCPICSGHKWHYVVQTDEGFRMGRVVGRRLLPMA
ncbi:metal-dependent hydrolase [Cohnella lubricantis]|uniref:metal-dependent hydrolase n=1 Tax=Cohnella lubricantis TaxID=2163172 RepID=UPI0031599E45